MYRRTHYNWNVMLLFNCKTWDTYNTKYATFNEVSNIRAAEQTALLTCGTYAWITKYLIAWCLEFSNKKC